MWLHTYTASPCTLEFLLRQCDPISEIDLTPAKTLPVGYLSLSSRFSEFDITRGFLYN